MTQSNHKITQMKVTLPISREAMIVKPIKTIHSLINTLILNPDKMIPQKITLNLPRTTISQTQTSPNHLRMILNKMEIILNHPKIIVNLLKTIHKQALTNLIVLSQTKTIL